MPRKGITGKRQLGKGDSAQLAKWKDPQQAVRREGGQATRFILSRNTEIYGGTLLANQSTPGSAFRDIEISLISPSPYQHRRTFSKLKELGESIARDGLVQPITVRKIGDGFELIAGERRLKAAREAAGLKSIMARVVDVDDHTARRMCATENMQRDDLSAIESVEATIEIVDAEFSGDPEYMTLGSCAGDRAKALLGKLCAVNYESASEDARQFFNKFIKKTDDVFAGLPKPIEWRSFYNNDLGITTIPESIKQWAAANKLNKSQTKELAKLAKASPVVFEELVSHADDDGVITLNSEGGESVPLSEVSAREIKSNLVGGGESGLKLAAHNHLALGTGENEWYTPDEYLESARIVLGGIDLDPASSELANKTVKAKAIYTQKDNGLEKPWQGKVWMNPPYSQPEIALFSEKLASEWRNGNVQSAIALTHNYTDTQWFHCLASACSAICFTRGRIGFVSPEGKTAAPTQGQAFFYFGDDPAAFHDEFSKHGFVVEVV